MLIFSRVALALFFVAAGTAHFIAPAQYLKIMPAVLPWPMALIFVSGLAEIAGGAGILWQRTRRLAGLGLIALLIAVFPANIYGAMHGIQIGQWIVPSWILWTRLPVQLLLIAWVYFASWKEREAPR